MISLPVGLALFLATLLVGRALKIRLRIAPVPWWMGEDWVANVIAPAIVTALVFGFGIAISALISLKLGVLAPASLAGSAGSVAVFVVGWRLLSAWSRRIGEGPAPAVQSAQNDPQQPPRVPPMKKAA